MGFIENIFSPELINAFGWTIIHSLWQGFVISFLLSIVFIILKKNNAKLRYLIALGGLGIICITSALTFKYKYQSSVSKPVVTENETLKEILPGFSVENNLQQSEKNEPEESLIQQFDNSMPVIVTLWMIGFIIFFMRYVGGFVYSQQLKHYKTFEVEEYWKGIINDLKEKFLIDKKIKLLESAIIKVPSVIGYFKPVVLLPLGTLASIPYQQAEAILLHELAHIKNRDYLINVFQKFIETIMFFNPAVWWISSVINREREYCCDDRVLEITGDSVSLAKALSNIEFEPDSSAYQMTLFKGNKNKLSGRIKRMNSKVNLKSSLLDAILIITILLTGTITTAAYSLENKAEYVKKTEYQDKSKVYFFFAKVDGKKKEFEVKVIDGKIKSVKIEGDKLSDREIKKYKYLIDEEIDEMNSGRKKTRKFRFDFSGESFDLDFDPDFDFDFDFDNIAEIEGNRISVNLDEIINFEKIGEVSSLVALKSLEAIKKIDKIEFLNSRKFKKAMKKLDKKMKNLNIRLEGLDEKLKELDERIYEVKEEMVKDGLIENADDKVNFHFKRGYLYINGDKQSKKISKKYEKLFEDIEIYFD